MRKFFAILLSAALLFCAGGAFAQESDAELEIVYAELTGANVPSYDEWMQVLTLQQVESYGMSGEIEGVQFAGEALILSCDLFDLEKGACAMPAALARSAGIAVGQQAVVTLPGGDSRTYTLAQTYEPIEDEDNYLPAGYIFVTSEDLADAVGRDAKDVFWPGIILCKGSEGAAAFIEQAEKMMEAAGVHFLTEDEWLDESPWDLSAPSPIEGPIAIDGTDLEGNAADNSLLNPNGPTFINIWATFCAPCLDEMPDLGKLQGEYPNVKFLGICADLKDAAGNLDADQVNFARQIIAQTGANYAHIAPGAALERGLLANVFAYPTTLIVDKDGNVLETYVGSRNYEDWKAILDSLGQ